ncbi:MAG: LysR family transcriptional regulator, partial [Comamonadaceae bacterium]
METKWLEDFVSLAETRSFSRSAQLRHVTQPAFSRRIQALEGWAGTDLVDRTSYPTRLTPAGQTLYGQALEVLQGLQSTRAMLRGHAAAGQDVIEFAVPHTLAFTFFPAWVTTLRERFGPIKSRLIALNVHDAVLRLVEGSCDLLISYQHPSQPLQLDANRYEMVSLGHET